MVFENMDGNPPGEEVLNRLTPSEWVGRSLYADQAALERALLAVETPLLPDLIVAIRNEPNIAEAGRLLFLSLPEDPNQTQLTYVRRRYAACLSYLRHFCRQPLFIDARLLAEKMLSRQPIDNDDDGATLTDYVTRECDLLVIRDFGKQASPQANDRLSLAISSRFWSPRVTILLGTYDQALLETFSIFRSGWVQELIRVVQP